MWGVVKLAMRAAIWRRTTNLPLVGLQSLLAFAALLAAVRAGLQLVEAGAWQDFNPYGLNAVITWIALELAIAALAAIAAVRTAEFNEFLAPERDAAVAAVAGANVNLGLVEKLHLLNSVKARNSAAQSSFLCRGGP